MTEMRFGFAPGQSHDRFDALRSQSSLAEDLGFDVLWMHEHHSQLYAERFLTAYGLWEHESVTELSCDARVYARLSRDRFVIGEAAECIERIEEYAELGIGHMACLMNFGSPDLDLVDRSMRSFADKVIPHFP